MACSQKTDSYALICDKEAISQFGRLQALYQLPAPKEKRVIIDMKLKTEIIQRNKKSPTNFLT